jgi:hypothetical protein
MDGSSSREDRKNQLKVSSVPFSGDPYRTNVATPKIMALVRTPKTKRAIISSLSMSGQ